jgi:hypothetical protein
MGIDAELLVRIKGKASDDQVRIWAYDLASAFGANRFMIDREQKWDGHHCLIVVDEWLQDGPTIVPEEWETFLKVNIWQRYYGEGYERGDLPFIIAVADYLERKIPNSSIWYGGDSSGVCAEPFGKGRRKELFDYFVKFGHKPYQRGFKMGDQATDPECSFCKEPMIYYGWGRDGTLFYCSGCNWRVRISKEGKIVEEGMMPKDG